ncbi:hypothetical protein GDO86_018867 [Hymenochirus boettgeri]|uniref:Tectonic-1-3 domain-containing protein n=1 Tax=Hymenochirus boettgeri TaxID=247094 RepID=A0A8T2IFQ9_9PIPI|nr:hypothetical protein GDO86_018867 [Hymenochirus boettgeri]
MMFRSNAPFSTITVYSSTPAEPQQFCVLTNTTSLNYFLSPWTISSDNFSLVSAKYSGASFSPGSQNSPVIPAFYQAGDPIYTISPYGTLGTLMQPSALGASGLCAFNNPARFLHSVTTSCLHVISNVNVSCMADPTLSTDFYYRNIRVIAANPTAGNFTGQTVPIVSLVTDTPQLQGNGCTNIVSEVNYTVVYNGTGGVVNVTVSFTLLNVTSGAVSLGQTFRVLYKPIGATNVQIRSGNPGYLANLPVLTDTGPLLIPFPVGGSCSSSPVGFGVNMLSGCTIRAQSSETCSDLYNRTFTALLGGKSPQYVGAFGNAIESGQWIPIIYQNCSTWPPGNCSSCSLPVSLNIQILQAKVGLLSNPQSQVLGTRFLFGCKLVQCQEDIVLQTQVSFTDLTQRGPLPRSRATIIGPLIPGSIGEQNGFALSLVLACVGYLLVM